MRTVSKRLLDLQSGVINLGFAGENEHTKVRIDCKKAFDQYPNAVPSMIVTPPKGDKYPATVTRDGDFVEWTVTDSDLIYDGDGNLQLSFTQDGKIMKSYTGETKIMPSNLNPGEVPTPIQNWIQEADQILDEAKAAAEHQPIIDDNGNWNVWDAEHGEYVDTGIKAQGEDGQPGRDGTDGQDGKDGKDGQDGAPGQDGRDGVDATPDLITVDYSDLTFPVAKDTYCYHDGVLYYAKQDIQTSEEWTAAHWQSTTVESEIDQIKSALQALGLSVVNGKICVTVEDEEQEEGE